MLLPEKLLPVDVEGFEVMLSLETFESSDIVRFRALGGGLAKTGVKAFKKSVYAVGGVIGVRNSASCLMTADRQAETGVEHISEGKEADRGVWRGGRTGLVTAVGDILTETVERMVVDNE